MRKTRGTNKHRVFPQRNLFRKDFWWVVRFSLTAIFLYAFVRRNNHGERFPGCGLSVGRQETRCRLVLGGTEPTRGGTVHSSAVLPQSSVALKRKSV
jgi:hypothetical protein